MPEQVRIQNFADLLQALEHPRPEVRLAVLKGLQEAPERALSLSDVRADEIPRVLVQRIAKSEGPERRLLLLTLCLFRSSESTEALRREFEISSDVPLLFTMARYLDQHSEVDLESFIWDQPRTARARAVANTWLHRDDLLLPLHLRISLLESSRLVPPAVGPDTIGAWVSELTGPLAGKARTCLERGPHDLWMLWDTRASLDGETLTWMLGRLPREPRERYEEALTWSLSQEALSEQAYLRYCEWSRDNASVRPIPTDLEKRFLDSSCVEVRTAAIIRGLADDKLEPYLNAAVEPEERLAALGRCRDQSRLLDLLSDADWRVRRCAGQRLLELEADCKEALRTRALTFPLETRVAASECLRLLGDVEWLKEHLA